MTTKVVLTADTEPADITDCCDRQQTAVTATLLLVGRSSKDGHRALSHCHHPITTNQQLDAQWPTTTPCCQLTAHSPLTSTAQLTTLPSLDTHCCLVVSVIYSAASQPLHTLTRLPPLSVRSFPSVSVVESPVPRHVVRTLYQPVAAPSSSPQLPPLAVVVRCVEPLSSVECGAGGDVRQWLRWPGGTRGHRLHGR